MRASSGSQRPRKVLMLHGMAAWGLCPSGTQLDLSNGRVAWFLLLTSTLSRTDYVC